MVTDDVMCRRENRRGAMVTDEADQTEVNLEGGFIGSGDNQLAEALIP
jgi:hypothetical protein